MAGNHPPAKIPIPMPPLRSTKNQELLSRPLQVSQQGRILEVAIEEAADAVIKLRDSLNEWDSKVGDGDCGSTESPIYPLNDAAETVNEIGASVRRVMGGTSGILYDIFCKAAYARLRADNKSQSVVTSKQWAEALEAAIAAVSKYGGATAGYRRMLDALIPAAAVLQERLNAGVDPSTAFVLSSEAAMAGAESTKHMQAQADRSTYISGEILASVPDPGAMAAASWYRAAALAVKEKYRAS